MFKQLKKSPSLIIVFLLLISGTIVSTLPAKAAPAYALPEFTQTSAQEWLNSKPLSLVT